MDPSTFQWAAGIAIGIILALIAWIARDMSDKTKAVGEDLDKAAGRLDSKIGELSKEDRVVRDVIDQKIEKLHIRINEQAKEIADLRETTAGFQGTFITRDEHGRQCLQQQQNSRGGRSES